MRCQRWINPNSKGARNQAKIFNNCTEPLWLLRLPWFDTISRPIYRSGIMPVMVTRSRYQWFNWAIANIARQAASINNKYCGCQGRYSGTGHGAGYYLAIWAYLGAGTLTRGLPTRYDIPTAVVHPKANSTRPASVLVLNKWLHCEVYFTRCRALIRYIFSLNFSVKNSLKQRFFCAENSLKPIPEWRVKKIIYRFEFAVKEWLIVAEIRLRKVGRLSSILDIKTGLIMLPIWCENRPFFSSETGL